MPARVNTQENKQQDGEAPQRRATIAEEWQWNTNNRCQAQHHADIDKYMKQEDAEHTIAIDASKG